MTNSMNAIVKSEPIEAEVCDDWELYARKINAAHGRSVSSVIEVGRLLIEAKEELDHGDFLRLFRGGTLPFGEDTAERLMRIAGNKILSNSANSRILPTSWTTLFELAKLPIRNLQEAIQDGKVHPGMRRQDVKKLLGFKSAEKKEGATLLDQLKKSWKKADQDTRVEFLMWVQSEREPEKQ